MRETISRRRRRQTGREVNELEQQGMNKKQVVQFSYCFNSIKS